MKLIIFASALVLAACTTQAPVQREQQVGQAVIAPLNDLNLVRADIPEALQAARKAPYGLPTDASCQGLQAEIHALDAVLGADLDAPPTASNPSLLERGANAAGDAAVGAIRSTAESVVPFRGWVRRLTGAERYSREVAAAITAGGIRRAWLKGMRSAKACPDA